MKVLLPGLFGAAILLAAAAAQAEGPAATPPFGQDAAGQKSAGSGDSEPAGRRPPRIIFGESEATPFQFRELPPLRRSDASSRQAYFGSGETYSATLSRLQAQMEAMEARHRLEQLPLTPAQEAAKGEMAPALVRALALSKRAREAAAE